MCMNNIENDYTFTWDANEKEGIILIVHDPEKQLEAIYGVNSIELRATPESGVTGNTTFRVKREVT